MGNIINEINQAYEKGIRNPIFQPAIRALLTDSTIDPSRSFTRTNVRDSKEER